MHASVTAGKSLVCKQHSLLPSPALCHRLHRALKKISLEIGYLQLMHLRCRCYRISQPIFPRIPGLEQVSGELEAVEFSFAASGASSHVSCSSRTRRAASVRELLNNIFPSPGNQLRLCSGGQPKVVAIRFLWVTEIAPTNATRTHIR